MMQIIKENPIVSIGCLEKKMFDIEGNNNNNGDNR